MRIVLLGPPGAGKGTQAVIIAKQTGVPHISTGEILRDAIARQTPLGIQVKEVLDRGDLVSDDVMIQLVDERVGREDCAPGFVLDGFPRTVDQAASLTEILERRGTKLDAVLDIIVPEEVLIGRIQQRAASSVVGRSDDAHTVVANRLKVYREQTAPVSGYYRTRGELRDVDGLGEVEEVTRRLIAAVGGR